jgi:Na+(H+)/acetate symporter ActP
VVLVGAVITLNVALGGMKGITLVQAFQYWAKMFAISVPIFVLMAVYGHYGDQLKVNRAPGTAVSGWSWSTESKTNFSVDGSTVVRTALPEKAPKDETWLSPFGPLTTKAAKNAAAAIGKKASAASPRAGISPTLDLPPLAAETRNSVRDFRKRLTVLEAVHEYAQLSQRTPLRSGSPFVDRLDQLLKGRLSNLGLVRSPQLPTNVIEFTSSPIVAGGSPAAAPRHVYDVGMSLGPVRGSGSSSAAFVSRTGSSVMGNAYEAAAKSFADTFTRTTGSERVFDLWAALNRLDVELVPVGEKYLTARMREKDARKAGRAVLSAPDRGVTLGAAIAGAARRGEDTAPYPAQKPIPFRADLSPDQHMTVNLDSPSVAQVLAIYADLTGRQLLPNTNSVAERVDDLLVGTLSKWKLISRAPAPDSGVRIHNDGAFTAAEVKSAIEAQLWTNGLALAAVGEKGFRVERAASVSLASSVRQQDAGGTLGADAEKAWLAKQEKPLALLYTYSLIMALVCGTAGLPHILVRFYTNPDGVAAKKTTMWVMILIGVFYLFPPVFGVMGRNLLPSLYAGTGAKGTDKVVLELPRILNDGQSNNSQFSIPNSQSTSPSADPALRNENLELKNAPLKKRGVPWGSILSGITCAGAFAAFMSTFSGLLVSMTGALAHDVYGRMLRPKATPEQRLRMFKICAVIIGGVAILLGTQVEPLQINFMVGQAFAIAAASYFPLLFMSVWWRGMTMKGAAVGMLAGGICALAAVTLTNFSDLKWIDLADFWAAHPLARIICEQPAIWTVPLAIGLMIVVSKLTQREVPSDVRMKMLVLHAPEQLGLKQEYIQEHQHGH